MSRSEFEYAIPNEDAVLMLQELCRKPQIRKKRYEIIHQGHLWEVDIFEDENVGLFLAEIELSSEGETFAVPEWVICEVTHDIRFYNAYLSEHPFKHSF